MAQSAGELLKNLEEVERRIKWARTFAEKLEHVRRDDKLGRLFGKAKPAEKMHRD